MLNLNDTLTRLHVDKLTPMQEATIREFETGHDFVLLAPTGTGKTLAYLLPLTKTLMQKPVVQAIVILPSRELAMQTEHVFKSMGTQIPAISCYGGRPTMDEHRQIENLKPAIIFATPGRLNDHLLKQNILTQNIRTIVIDEFDKCLELGFHDEMESLISFLPKQARRILLSATDTPSIPDFITKHDFRKLNFLNKEEQPAERITVFKVKSPEKDKLHTLSDLLCSEGLATSLVFVNYRESVERVATYLQQSGFACEAFHGGMEQEQRERALYKFINASCNVLISTDLASRGLDIPFVDNIVHYHLPLNKDAYIHRNGRTARWHAKGKAFILLGPQEKTPEFVGQAQDYIFPNFIPSPVLTPWTTIFINKGKKNKINKIDIVGFLTKVGNLSANHIGRIDVKPHYAFAAVWRSDLQQLLTRISGQKIKGVKALIGEAK